MLHLFSHCVRIVQAVASELPQQHLPVRAALRVAAVGAAAFGIAATNIALFDNAVVGVTACGVAAKHAKASLLFRMTMRRPALIEESVMGSQPTTRRYDP